MNLLSGLTRLGMRVMPVIRGRIERRMLVTLRVRPEVAARLIPGPLQARIVKGWCVAGVCLIRLGQTRVGGMPAWMGLNSENAAHRFAVQWLENGNIRDGVYIARRDTDSRANQCFGGRLFPGVQHHAKFEVWESAGRWRVGCGRSGCDVKAVARAIDGWPAGSIFGSLKEAEEFYRAGRIGWSPSRDGEVLEGMELSCDRGKLEPLLMERFESRYFQNGGLFPKGSVEFDSACVMRDVEHEWRCRGFLERTDHHECAMPSLVPARAGDG